MLKKLSRVVGILVFLTAFLGGVSASAQNKAIRGKIVDGQGIPVVGAGVVVVGNTSIGAVTDLEGTYRLNVPAGSSLEVSCIGYATQVIPVGDKTVVDVVLAEDVTELEETVVISMMSGSTSTWMNALSSPSSGAVNTVCLKNSE